MQNEANDGKVLTAKEVRRLHIRNLIADVVIFIAVFVAVILFFRKYQFPTIDGESMSPSFHNNDRVMAVVTKDVSVGDVAVLWSDDLDEYIVKRVVGVAGDHIVIDGGSLYRNDTRVYEDYINDQSWGEPGVRYDITVPEGRIYVLGDNRNESTDSRVLGTIDIDDVYMKVISITNWIKRFG